MKYMFGLVLGVLFLPTFASAAGFAKQSLFLSKSPVVEGESVLVHAVVQNDATAKFDGQLVFSAQLGSETKENIGSVAVSIAAGGAQAVSVSWKPVAGEYAVTAALTQANGSVVEEETAHFTINKKPEPASKGESTTVTNDNPVESSADVQAMIAKFSPTVADITEPVFSTIDSFRVQTGKMLDQGLAWSKTKVAGKKTGDVLGSATSKENTSPKGLLGTATFLFATLSLYVLSVIKWVVANTWVFYPTLMIGFLLLLFKLMGRIRRPQY